MHDPDLLEAICIKTAEEITRTVMSNALNILDRELNEKKQKYLKEVIIVPVFAEEINEQQNDGRAEEHENLIDSTADDLENAVADRAFIKEALEAPELYPYETFYPGSLDAFTIRGIHVFLQFKLLGPFIDIFLDWITSSGTKDETTNNK